MDKKTLGTKIYNFFEQPKGFWAIATQIVIFFLIVLSVANVVIEFFYHPLFLRFESLFHLANNIILAAFTVEYVLRLYGAPKKLAFVRRPMSIVDFLAIFPNYVEFFLPFFVETTEIRALRIIRFLRFVRVLRVLRVFRYASFFKRIFQYQNTILQAITPILGMFIGLKAVIWVLEVNGWWIDIQGLGELFAIIGFALGIILSQKISATYDKFLQVEEAIVRLYGTLSSLREILDSQKKNLGTTITKLWAKDFLSILKDPKANNFAINRANSAIFKAVSQIEKTPSEVTMLHGEISRDAAFCLSKKVRITPKAYDNLLQQSTVLYLTLIAVFIPGITGMISTVVATYILYGMYNITQDLDSIFGGEFSLMNIDMTELEYLVEN
ncbi:hypothetical protein A3H81_04025 [Candidatus Daviesbacteria bacterium RIFCSPLOWO2_02_FULL_38_18]|uniref:Voltage-gated potassium channel n=1 Tax=Candidatus Daviesbacteria bacterium GW2011_GWF2_38_6 TaxID=1618432 RepID=A0A0G0MY52_9BACT|nr:MAG: Voltage-gated potassium channel [Candidatus Daviesbacteria bacterium GW2011_GWF2_38_6]OGE26134.1 MAG: hypothetical protein A3D02_00520 [Candidatus Daviesbacteria bacterium RIFCSPHIGHO2_02_FULL_39_41]OGE43795.1 MAG: hypothetical protein A3E67_03460 [Candidatus Daviesbacteria bacterium RIFCSPHIGHO2_12_FULL_38_25]OGE68226.1 MAG: hypothetical protein A3H81_04025 [Candidatus Daviesbacteria bacterium RIFCSPLOWO2_02_FULL_38_18]OGE72339.1 MAG: hypothetical protein A3H18_01345 [Candidatus Davies